MDTRAFITEHLSIIIAGGMLTLLLALATFKLYTSQIRLARLTRTQETNLEQRRETELALQQSNQELEQAMKHLHEEETRLVQSEKLAAIGQVAAGVAHEINNPVGFIMSNLFTLREYLNFLFRLQKAQARKLEALQTDDSQGVEKHDQRLRKLLDEDDPDFIFEDGETLILESQDGALRVKEIVLNLKTMSQVDQQESCLVDVNEGVRAVQAVMESRPDCHGEIRLDLVELPEVFSHPGELNQALMNLVINAVQHSPCNEPIDVRTTCQNDQVQIMVRDRGPGISADNQDRIFNPFYTTRPAGQGAGLGLSLARDIVLRHQGTLTVDSAPGQGTTFTMTLPAAPMVPA